MRWLARGAAALALCGSVVSAAAVQLVAPQAVTDDRGRTVQLPGNPQRIVSLLPSLTESVCALQLCDRLVGVDRYSNWPESVRKLPVLGGGIDPNIEAVVAMKPDVVLLSRAARVADRLEALGLKVVVVEVNSQQGVHKALARLARLLGVPEAEAEKVWREINAGVDAAAQAMPASAKNARVYFEVSRGPYAAGPQSFIGETLTRLGVRNVVPPELGPFPRLSPEFLVRANPDVIMMGSRSMQVATSYPGWERLAAVMNQRVCIFPQEEADIIVRPGPRMAEAARLMARCLTDKLGARK
ncbi:ABC transporter substrate-binding protein [Comamonas phosphati]|nr:ABC transporter substrate-binding protein [Comamonas phosphati]